jgi:hypothetical protein
MSRHNFLFKALLPLFTLLFFATFYTRAASRYWVGGASASWAVTTSWSATSGGASGATVPTTTDDVIFDASSGATITVSSIPTATIHSLTVNGSNTVTLTSAAANQTLSLNIGAASNALVVSSGSTLILGSSTATFTLSFITTTTQKADISGTLQVNTSNAFTTTTITTASGVTVSSTGVIKNNGGAINGSTTSLNFASGGTYNHAATAGTVPTATWNSGSNCNITSGSSGTVLGLGQSFSNFTMNTAAAVVITLSTNPTITGTLTMTQGVLALASQTLTLSGTITGSGATFTTTSGSVLSIGGTTGGNYGTLYFTGGSQTIGTFTVNRTGASPSVDLGNTLIVQTALNLTSGSVTASTGGLTVGIAATAVTTTRGSGSLAFVPTWGYTTGAYNITYNGAAAINTGNELPSSATPTNGTLTVSTGGTNVTLMADANIGTLTTSLATTTTFNLNGFTLGLSLTTPLSNTGVLTANASGSTLKLNGSVAQTFTLAGTYTGSVIDNLISANTNVSGATLGSSVIVNNFSVQSGLFSLGASNTLTITGTYTNSGTLTANGASCILELKGGSPQNFSVGTYTGSVITNLKINNSTGVTLTAPVNATTLTLTSGLLTSTSANLITVTGTATTNISGGSATTYVNGPLARTFPATLTTGTYTFPVGRSIYNLFELVNPTTSSAGTVVVTAEVFDAAPGGIDGVGFSSGSSNRYWSATKSGAGAFTSTGNIRLTDGSITFSASNVVGNSGTSTGTYNTLGGTVVSSTIASVVSAPVTLGYYMIGTKACIGSPSVTTTYTVGPTGDFAKLTNVANTLNNSTICGNLVFEFQSTYDGTTGETFPIAFNALNYSGGPWTVTIRPNSSVASTLTVSGSSTTQLINLNGADYLTFDGRPGGAGSSKFLTFSNTSTTGSVFQFISDATNNTLKYCVVKGVNTSTTSGNIVLSTASAGGNDNNTVDNCDLTSGASAAANIIYASGTASPKDNSSVSITNNNISNFSGTTACGINIGTGNSAWTITGNSFFQTAALTTASTMYGIQIVNTTGGNFTVSNNYFGGNASALPGSAISGTWTANTSGLAYNFCAISVSLASSPASTISGNIIQNYSIVTGTGTQTAPSAFCGIYVINTGGSSSVTGNTVGSSTLAGNISVSFSTNALCSVYGIYVSANGSVSATTNNVAGISILNPSSGTLIENLYGIYATASSTGPVTITGNTVGSSTAGLSNATGNTYNSTGTIYTAGIFAPAALTNNISTNAVTNVAYTAGGTSSGFIQTVGIFHAVLGTNAAVAGSSNTVQSNTISNINSSSPNAVTDIKASVVGLLFNNSSNGNTVGQNIIHSVANTASTTNAVNAIGLLYGVTTSGTNVLERNFIHSITLSSSGTTASINGIYVLSGNSDIRNNMVRLGIDKNGSNITTGYTINGINEIAGTNNYYFNSVYLGGTGVVSSSNSFAFTSAVSSGTRAIQDNIFWNARSNSSGAGKNYAFKIGTTTGLTSSYNDLFASGTGAVLGNIGGTDNTTLSSLSSNSVNGDPQFINVTGNASTVDLHISTSSSTPIEAVGTAVASVGYDYDNDDRSVYSPTDLGADAGNFIGIDLTAPAISYTALSGNCNGSTTNTVSSITITDGSGINTTSGTKPRVYYKKSTDANDLTGWKYVEASNSSSPFSFTINYSLLNSGSVSAGDVIQYFFVAQDQGPYVPATPNVAINSGTFNSTPTSVALTSGAFPIGGAINSFSILPCSGTVTVGTGGNYPAFTTATGLFQAINATTLTGNLTVNVVSSISIEDGTNALNQWSESGIGNYTLTIQPIAGTASAYTISGTYNGAAVATAGLFRMNGADRVTIDGRDPSNLLGGGKFLLFRNSDVTASSNLNSTFTFINDAKNNTLRYCQIEGATLGATNGVVYFAIAATGGSGNTGNTIDNCIIKNAGGTNTTLLPTTGILSNGSGSGLENSNITISNNLIYDFFSPSTTCAGIRCAGSTTGSTGWTITGNSIYETAARNFTTTSTDWRGISIECSSENNFTISNNYIGGGAASCGGSALTLTSNSGISLNFVGIRMTISATGTRSSIQGNTIANVSYNSNTTAPTANGGIVVTAGAADIGTITGNIIGSNTTNGSFTVSTTGGKFQGILFGTGGACDLNIQNNVISGFSLTGSGATSFYGIAATTNAPTALTINNNTIGSTTLSNSIDQGTPALVYGIYQSIGTNSYSAANNTIANIRINTVSTAAQFIGINFTTGINTISGNTIKNISSTAQITSTAASASVIGISNTSATAGQTISANTIHSLSFGGSSTCINFTGIYVSGATTGTNVVERNFIHSFSLSSTCNTATATGIEIAAGNSVLRNNMIRLGILPGGTAEPNSNVLIGINDNSTTANSFYFNTILIDGTSSSVQTGNSYAFKRSAASGTDDIRNNIFANNRTGGASGSTHYAFATNTATVTSFDYNIFYSSDGSLFSTNNGTSAVASPKLQGLRAAYSSGTGQNLRSGVATLSQINFISPSTDASSVNLRLNSANCAAGAGTAISGITSDFDNTVTRATPPAIGAHESASFTAITSANDIYTPIVSVSTVSNLSASCGSNQTVTITATVTDLGTGVGTGSFAPTLWWRLSTGTFASLAVSSSSGNSFTFSLNLSSVSAGQTYQYYVAAQDQASTPNVWYSSFNATSPVHANVTATPSPINGSPSTFSVVSGTPLSGTINVGTGNTYTALTTASGLFAAINANGLSGNLIVNITSNTTEDGNQSLYQWTEYCGSGYTITIQPSSASVKTLSGSLIGMGLFNIYASRVIIDGRYNGSGRYLKFVNTYASTGGSENDVFKFDYFGASSFASNDVIRYCEIVGASTKTAGGVIYMASGCYNMTIDNNLIHGDLTNWAGNIILCDGALQTNHDISITNNEIYNFMFLSGGTSTRAYGIRVTGNSNGSSWTITGNSFYNTNVNTQGVQTAIDFSPGSSSTGNTISNNYIGGSSAQCGTGGSVTYWGNSYDAASTEVRIYGVNVSAGTVTLDNNNISNIFISGCDYTGFVGMYIGGSTVATITNNIFGTGSNGQPDNSKLIKVSGGGCTSYNVPGYIYGIWNTSTTTSTSTYTRNYFYYLWQSGAGTGGSVQCILHQAAGPATITYNVINGPQAVGSADYGSNGWNSFGIRLEPTASTSGNLIEANLVAGPYINNYSTLTYGSINYGIRVLVNNTYTVSGTIDKNVVWDMRNADRAGYTEGIYVYSSTGGNGNWDIYNNQVTLKNNGSSSNCVGIYGIEVDLNSSSTTNVQYNTVYISGSNGGSPVASYDFSSYAYFRYPNSSGTVTGDALTLRNNIFINNRLVSNGYVTGHFAVANYGSSNYTSGWNTSDYNFMAVANGSKSYLGQWGTTTESALSNWKAASGTDANSNTATYTSGSSNYVSGTLNADSLFSNPLSNLHISITDGQGYKYVDAQATPISITTDYDGDTRNATSPDKGADEFTVCSSPSVSTPPASQTICASSSVTFSVTATGTPTPTYQWRKNGTNISGATASSYTINPVSSADAASYDVVLTNSCATVTSSAATLTVNPVSVAGTVGTTGNGPTICVNTSTTIIVSGNTGSVQWQDSPDNSTFTDISGATATSYNTPLLTANRWYRAVVTSGVCSSATTGSQKITVSPAIANNIVSGTQQICSGSTPTTLTGTVPTGGNSSYGYQWQISTDNVIFTDITSATSQNYSPTALTQTTYYLRIVTSGGCIDNSAVVQVTVNPLPVVSNFTAVGLSNACIGTAAVVTVNSTTLTAGTYTVIYDISGTNTATGNTSSMTFASGSGTFTTSVLSNAGSTTVTITSIANQSTSCSSSLSTGNSTSATIASAPVVTATVQQCMNASASDYYYVSVSASGGTTPYTWSGSPVMSVANSNKIYEQLDGTSSAYTVTDAHGCAGTSNVVTTPTGHSTTIPFVSATATCYDLNLNKWLTFLDNSNNAILSINDNNQNLANVNVTVYKDNTEAQIPQSSSNNCLGYYNPAMKRHFMITSSAAQPFSSSVKVRLYFADSELQSLIAASAANDIPNNSCSHNDNIYDLNGLYVTKYSGINEDGNYSNNSATGIYKVYGNTTNLPTQPNGPLAKYANGFSTLYQGGANHHFVELSVNEFSEFWLHGSQNGTALPVEMLYLEANAIDNSFIQVKWATAVEINNNGFEVQRSTDGTNWSAIGWVAGHNNSTTEQMYNYNDYQISSDVHYYYRLKQIDNNGDYKFTDVVTAMLTGTVVFSVKDFIPNPAVNTTSLILNSSTEQNVQVEFFDVLGKKVFATALHANRGSSEFTFDISMFAAGTYTTLVSSSNDVFTKKLVITR